MNNVLYENNYSQYVEPIYGNLRNQDEDDIESLDDFDSNCNNSFKIDFDKRVDLTNNEVFSIDPDGCEDADDAFSIFEENNKLYLAIHIADPTEYIKLNSDLWRKIIERTTTKYPSNRRPIHMIPEAIMKISSLKGDNEIKKTISILTEINKSTYKPVGEIKLLFSKILVKLENSFSYKKASETKDFEVFKIGLKISNALQEIRSKNTKGVKLNELSIAYTKFNNNIPYLYQDSEDEKLMKQMIAEFAIFANSFVGQYLESTKLIHAGIFRTCDAKDWLNNTSDNITGEEMIQQIVTKGITADYMSNVKSHDLVGMPEYCHFTSPIRRLADCICHYLLKYIYFLENDNNQTESLIPFSIDELERLSLKCVDATKKDKKNQYLDIKFRLLQVMDNMIFEKGSIILEYYITGYSGLFLNIVICKIDNYRVYMSYTLRVRNYSKEINVDEHQFIICTKVNCFTKFDQNCIPELDSHILF